MVYCVFNFASISAIYGAFTMLPLGDATVVISTTPVFTAILAYLVLLEPWHKMDVISTAICLLGVVLITRPTFIFHTDSSRVHTFSGYIVALLGVILQSVTFTMVRGLGQSTSFLTNVFYFGWCSALLSVISMFAFQKPVIPDCGAARWSLIAVGKCI
ncbi:solute carrier family 35 member G1-like [Nematostella vectensis]|uniref:solute carrier family 35 member G1-like n=1 Tax=Nematostella vectensis TaxID=45351 RepID=UPI0020770663|nr:solute carrier family 35 member G1-like [Nematostella vectensis]